MRRSTQPRAFRCSTGTFVEGDFITLPWLEALVLPAQIVRGVLLAAYATRALWEGFSGRTPNDGKHLVVATTALTWYVGIVWTNSDFQFTVTNVLVHGLPYMALLWVYTRERGRERPGTLISRVASLGVLAFAATLLAIVFAEEML